jgi:carbamoyltransferase
MLADGAVVGWFTGRSEFGPRALGHRSILADPRRTGLKDLINRNIKFREDFRPFAPAVAAEHASTYFDAGYASPYMLLVAPARPEHADSIRDVTHVDGSCRLQTVSPAEEPTFHALLTAFARRTGLPVLLNTSFNRRGMPIVETPGEAIDFFLECALDVLVIENFVVGKKKSPAHSGTAIVGAFR